MLQKGKGREEGTKCTLVAEELFYLVQAGAWHLTYGRSAAPEGAV